MKRAIIIAVVVIVALALAGPFLPLGFLKPGIAGALTQSLGRRVEIDGVSLTLFPSPALALNGVSISEDPRAGIEPFAYAETVDAQVNPLGMLGARRKFSRLRLTGATLNLVKTSARGGSNGEPNGPWNVQFLLDSADPADVPAIQMRAGRVNLKLGQTKSVGYFDDVDLDVSINETGAVDLRFSGEPARTDRPAEAFSHFFLRGVVASPRTRARTNLQFEMEPAPLESVARLFGVSGYSLQGQAALSAQIATAPAGVEASALELKGDLEFRDDRRTSILPQIGGKGKLRFEGSFDEEQQALRIATVSESDEKLAFTAEAMGVLSRPRWSASLLLREAPLDGLYAGARQLGVPITDKMTVAGTVSGTVEAGTSVPVKGQLTLSGASITPPGAAPLQADEAIVNIAGNTISLWPVKIDIGAENATESVTFEASARVGSDSDTNARLTTHGLTVATIRKFDVSGIPVPSQIQDGLIRGVVRFHRAATGEDQWSGEYQLVNARVNVDGIAEPIHVITATVSSGMDRTSVSRIRASAGKAMFTGEYQWSSAADRPHRFRLQVDPVDGAEMERLFKPTLERSGGFFERTLRLGTAAQLPDWLMGRRAAGTIAVRSMNIAGHPLTIDSAALSWDGADVEVTDLKGRIDGDTIQGSAAVDLAGRSPRYHLEGRYQNASYKGGKLEVNGAFDATGTGKALSRSFRAQGSFDARGISFSPEADFRSIAGKFNAAGTGGALRWKLTDLDAAMGADSYTGEGSSQPDGKITLDLMNRERQLRLTGTITEAEAQTASN
jgi:hypothetical protein